MAKTDMCSVCSEKCVTDCIFCETCEGWFHYGCQNINDSDARAWQKTTLGYICINCRCDDAGQLDFLMGLGRLSQATKGGVKKLKIAADREKLFLKDSPVETTLHNDFATHKQDPISNFIISNYGCTTKSALFSSGDGDCLFNSFSILLVGDESKSLELRYRCCVEMVTNRSKIMIHRMYGKLEVLSPDYDKDCLDCPHPGKWSSAWMVIAMSNVLNIPVKSVYPSISGTRSAPFKTLNHVFKPPFSDPEKGVLTILWTNTSVPQKNRFNSRPRPGSSWLPNHFVPLVDVPMTDVLRPEADENHIPLQTKTESSSSFQSPNRYTVPPVTKKMLLTLLCTNRVVTMKTRQV